MQVDRWCGWLSNESPQAEKNSVAVSDIAANPESSVVSAEEQVEQRLKHQKLVAMFDRDQRCALSNLVYIIMIRVTYLPFNSIVVTHWLYSRGTF